MAFGGDGTVARATATCSCPYEGDAAGTITSQARKGVGPEERKGEEKREALARF